MAARQTPNNLLSAPLSAAIDAEANRLNSEYGISAADARRILNRLASCVDPAGSTDPESARALVRESPFSVLADALGSLPVDRVVSLLDIDNPRATLQRLWATELIVAHDTPFFTLAELADHFTRFETYLREHRTFLIKTGLPPEPFLHNRWLYVQLGRLYDTRQTSSPYPYAELFPHTAIPNAAPYSWIRWPDRQSTRFYYPERCNYEQADFIKSLDRADAEKIEGDRPKLLAMKRRVVRVLRGAIQNNDANAAWSDSMKVLVEHLSGAEIKFLLKLDRLFLARDVRAPGFSLDPASSPGGLTNMLDVIGHVEKEIRIGTLARTKTGISSRQHDVLFSDVADRFHGSRYFAWVSQGVEPPDTVLDDLCSRCDAEAAFWSEFRSRCEEAFQNDFRVNIHIDVWPCHKALLQPILQEYANHIQRQRDAGAWVLNQAPPPTLSIFRKDGNSWTIAFDGKILAQAHSDGLFYLWLLISKPGSVISAGHLRCAKIRFEKSPDARKALAAATGNSGHENDSDEIREAEVSTNPAIADAQLDDVAISEYQRQLDELSRVIAAAQENGLNQERIGELIDQRTNIEQSISVARPFGGGRTQKISEPTKKDADAVRNAINRTLDDLKTAHAVLYTHLRSSTRIGSACCYNPQPPVAWNR